jgi:hypothetical protein
VSWRGGGAARRGGAAAARRRSGPRIVWSSCTVRSYAPVSGRFLHAAHQVRTITRPVDGLFRARDHTSHAGSMRPAPVLRADIAIRIRDTPRTHRDSERVHNDGQATAFR